MSAKYGSMDPNSGMITVRVLLIFAVMITALFATVQTAQAAGTPAKIISFTDKKEYMAWWMDAKTTTPGFNKLNDEAQYIFVYAVVLDDDGNIMKNRNIQVIMNDTVFDHWDKGNWNVHNAIVSNNTYFKTAQNLNDTGTFNDSIANDGLYTSMISMNSTLLSDVQTTTTPYKVDNQIRVKLVVVDIASGLNTTTYVLVTGGKCHQSGTTSHPAHITNTAADLCTDCHEGYEHFFENVSGTIPDEYLDIHFKKLGLLADSTEVVKGMQAYNWNSTQFDGNAPYGSSASWRSRSGGGALYCRFCHKDPSGSNWYDYGNGDRTNLNDRPSCARSDCHPATEIEGTTVIPWSQGGAVAGNDTLRNINNQKSHNHTTTPTANVPCTICHAIPHGQTMPNMSANISAGGNINAQCWYCHNISGGINITSNGGSNVDHSNNDCKSCHSNDADALDVHKVPSAGGPDCISCHDYGKTANIKINNSAMNSSNASHARLNNNSRNSSDVSAQNKKCWGCHTSNGSQPGNNSMGNRNDNPYKCYDCHNATSKPYANVSTGMNVSEHFKGGARITAASTAADNSSSCVICHNLSELKVAYTEDDSYSTDYSLSSHYARNRTDLRTWNSSRAVNCSYCHQNASTAFSVAMLDPAYNRSIQNHSASSSPACFNSTCHGSGWIHNSTLTRPALPLPNSTYCQLCHPEKQKHNGTQNCTLCHLNTSGNDTIHPIKYLQMNGSFITSNSSAVNCSNCHQGAGITGFGSAPRIPKSLNHSSNTSNGTIWGNYWNWNQSSSSSCYYCHNNTKHNSTALGNANFTLNSYNVKNGSLATTQWCADCHYNDSINTDFKGSLWNPAPPYISYDNTGKSGWTNHSSYFSSGYNDSVCKACHALNGSYAATSLNYSHSLDPGAGGNPNCITCHNLVTGLSGGAPSGINFTAANASVHNGTNSNNATAQGFVPVIGSCWACHDSDGNVTSGHPDRYKQPKTCTECHIGTGIFNSSAYNAIIVSEHFYGGANIKAGNSISNISSCINCHENISEMVTYNNDTDYGTSFTGDGIRLVGGNRSFYHYGADRSGLRTWNSSRAVNCSYCHQNATTAFSVAMLDPAYNRSIQNHSAGNSPVCFNSTCHDSGWIHNSTLTRPSMPLPNSTYCQLCHLTKQKHNGSQSCTLCHVNTSSSDTIHPIKYLLVGNSFGTSSSQAVNCSDCHQNIFSGFTSAPIIPAILKHSSRISNGTIWGSYWGATGASSQNNTNVSQEAVTTGTTSGIAAAQTADGSFETMTEGDTGGAPVDQYTYVSSNTTTNGTITNWVNMQSASDGGAYATLTEAGSGGSAPGTSNATANAKGSSDNTNDLLADVQSDDTSGNSPTSVVSGDGWYTSDKSMVMFIDDFNTTGMSGTVTAATLWVQYSVESGYSGNNQLRWAFNGSTLNNTGIQPADTQVDIIASYNLFAQGVDTLAEISTLDLEFTNNDGGGPQAVSFDYVWIQVTYSGGSSTYSMNITTDTASVPAASNHYLEINYSKTSADDYDVYVFDGSVWNNRGTLNSALWTVFNYTLTGDEYNGGDPRVRYIDQNSSGTTQGNLYIDYQRIHSVSSGSSNYRLDIRQNVTGIPSKDYYYLTVKGKTDNAESYDVMVYDSGSGWVTKSTINSDTTAWYNTSLTAAQISGGKVLIRYADTDISSDTVQNTLSIDYAGVRSENLTAGNSSCEYCHGNTKHNATALGTINTLLADPNNTRGGSLTVTTYCVDCHYNNSINANYYGTSWDPVPPLITIDNTEKGGWINHSTYLGSGYKDENCMTCHELNGSYLPTSLNYSHSFDPGMGGGPNCITCHNLVTGLSGGAPVGINFTAANTSSHNGTNSNNATQRGFAPIIGACWACHDSDGNVSSGHPDRYKNPKTCTECHIGTGTYNASAYNANIVDEHFSRGTDIKAGNSTSNISSCINCHENVSEMILYNNDTDYGSFTGDGIRLKGGNMSFYHYGKDRTDIRTGNSVNCSYCHQNSSTAFALAMINSSYNSSIGNHSNYSSNPGCTSSQCHNTGWIHNSTLTKPDLGIQNSTFCLNCHGKNSTSGLINFTGAVTSIKDRHNNSVNCTECHQNTAKDVHPVKYLRQDATFSTLNTSAVNCITCHQATSVDSKLTLSPPKIATPMHHSDNTSNGTIWNSTAYWTPANPLTSCTYCHNDTKHNASALGRPSGWQGNNVVNSSLASGNWCASCHYKNYTSGSRNYNDMTQAFTSVNLSVPPEITNGSYAIKIFNRSDYYNHSLTDYSDVVCKLCHGANISSASNVSELMHNVTIVNTCTGCHYSFEAMNNTTRPDRYVDFSMYNTSLHRSLSCTDCHTQGHKNMGARKACEDCHAVQANPITDKDRHNITITPSTYYVGGNNVVGITDCTTCHDSVLYNRSISTYGYWKPKDCDYCHTYPDKYYE